MNSWRFAIVLCAFACACSSDRLRVLTRADGTDIQPARVEELRQDEARVVYALAQLSDIDACDPNAESTITGCRLPRAFTATEWEEILLTGFRVVDRECEQYLQALFWFENSERRLVDEIGIGTVAASAIVGLTSGSSESISILAAAAGFLGATIENVGSGLLYDIGPYAVFELVERNQTAYLQEALGDVGRYRSRARVMWAIQNYAAICLPPAIEAEVRRSIERAAPTAATPASGAPPVVGQGVDLRVSTAPENQRVRIRLIDHVLAGEGDANLREYLRLATAAGIAEARAAVGTAADFRLAQRIINDPANAPANAEIAKQIGLLGE